MQIVIDIPEEDYKAIKNMSVVGDMTIPYVFDAVRNGKPLPKGHGRLVDISEYEDNYCNVAIKYDDGNHIHEKYTFALLTIIEADKGADNG